jgi:hypothetical protein
MGWREDARFGQVRYEFDIRPQDHVTAGIGLSVETDPAEIEVDASKDILVLFTDDGTTLKFKDNTGTVQTVTAT